MRERDVCACCDVQVVCFQADGPVVFVEPPDEVAADCLGSGELERGYDVVVDDVGGIQLHQLVDVLSPAGLDPRVQECRDLGSMEAIAFSVQGF